MHAELDSTAARATPRARKIPTVARAVLTSAATFDWGSSPALQRFAAAVLAPAASSGAAIDLDCATSAYWHRAWLPACRAAHFFDGSKPTLDALERAAWIRLAQKLGGMIGAVFCNPPGLENGGAVQAFWAMLEGLQRTGVIGSLVWVGFNLDQARSLIPVAGRPRADGTLTDGKRWSLHPLHPDTSTVFPGKRISYLAQPEHMITILDKRLASRRCKGSERERVIRRRGELAERIAKGDLAPVPGPSPVHASYLTVLWHRDREIANRQVLSMQQFLADEQDNAKSVFRPYAEIGGEQIR